MDYPQLLEKLEMCSSKFTATDRQLADFFTNTWKLDDISARYVTEQAFTSFASLTRFAKKLGYRGYREFAFDYRRETPEEVQGVEKTVHPSIVRHEAMVRRCAALLDPSAVKAMSRSIVAHPRVQFYGVGSSGLAAQDVSIRLSQMGIDASSVVDVHQLRDNHRCVDQSTMIVGFSLSAQTTEIMEALMRAKECGACVHLLTAQEPAKRYQAIDAVHYVAEVKKSKEGGVSPQLPILVYMDAVLAEIAREKQAGA